MPSDRLARYLGIYVRASNVWEGEIACRAWLTAPAAALGGNTPCAHAATYPGAQRVERLLNQIEEGIVV